MLSDFIKQKQLLNEEDTSLGALAIGGVYTDDSKANISQAIDLYDNLKVQKAIIDFFTAEKSVNDEKLKKLAGEIGISYENLLVEIYHILSSFFAEGDWNLKDKVAIDPKQLDIGTRHEAQEHASGNLLIGRKIALDHLSENGRYYDFIEKMEANYNKPGQINEEKEIKNLVGMNAKILKDSIKDEYISKYIGQTGEIIEYPLHPLFGGDADSEWCLLKMEDGYNIEIPLSDIKILNKASKSWFKNNDKLIDVIKKRQLNEAISAEERKQITDYTKELKKWLKNKYPKIDWKVNVLKTVGPNPWVQVRCGWPEATIPNEFRIEIIKKIMPEANILNWDDISYGNINERGLSLYYSEWKKLTGELTSKQLNESKEDDLKAKIRNGWSAGKSIQQMEQEFNIKIKLKENSSFSTLQNDLLTGNFDIETKE